MAPCPHTAKRKDLKVTAFDSIVDVIVGQSATTFTVYKSLLVGSTRVFKAALEGSFKEATEQEIKLPDVSPEVFQRFMLWMYTASLIGDGESASDLSSEVLVRLYIFGDTYGIEGLQNCTMDTLKTKLDLSNKGLSMKIISLIYENTVKGCSLRRFAVERAIFRGSIVDMFGTEADIAKLPPAFCLDLILLFNDLKDGKVKAITANGWKRLGCRYHVHPTEGT
ncbi:MAG: hypothetical protein Q9195_001274 [Heterodermia aff. obscurata]